MQMTDFTHMTISQYHLLLVIMPVGITLRVLNQLYAFLMMLSSTFDSSKVLLNVEGSSLSFRHLLLYWFALSVC